MAALKELLELQNNPDPDLRAAGSEFYRKMVSSPFSAMECVMPMLVEILEHDEEAVAIQHPWTDIQMGTIVKPKGTKATGTVTGLEDDGRCEVTWLHGYTCIAQGEGVAYCNARAASSSSLSARGRRSLASSAGRRPSDHRGRSSGPTRAWRLWQHPPGAPPHRAAGAGCRTT